MPVSNLSRRVFDATDRDGSEPTVESAGRSMPYDFSFLTRIFGRKCPSCQQRGFLRQVSSQVISSKPGFGTVTREKRIKNADGEVIRTEEWDEQVHVVRKVTRETYLCNNCKNRSFWDKTTEVEA